MPRQINDYAGCLLSRRPSPTGEGTITERSALIQTYLEIHEEPTPSPEAETEPLKRPVKRLKRYYNE